MNNESMSNKLQGILSNTIDAVVEHEKWKWQLVQMWDDGMHATGSAVPSHLLESALISLDSPGTTVFINLFESDPSAKNILDAYSKKSISERHKTILKLVSTKAGREWWYFLRHGLTLAALTYEATGNKIDVTMDLLNTAFTGAFPTDKLKQVSPLSIAGRNVDLSTLLNERRDDKFYDKDLQAAIWEVCKGDYFAYFSSIVFQKDGLEQQLVYLRELFAGKHKDELRKAALKAIQKALIQQILAPELKQHRATVKPIPIPEGYDPPDIDSNDFDTVETKLLYEQIRQVDCEPADRLCLQVYYEGAQSTLREAYSRHITECHEVGLSSPEAIKMRISRFAERYHL
jgi:hypothetical protein